MNGGLESLPETEMTAITEKREKEEQKNRHPFLRGWRHLKEQLKGYD